MKRINCPFCNKVVTDNAAAGKIINGRGIFKTTILYHKSCYDEFITHKLNSALFREVLNENK